MTATIKDSIRMTYDMTYNIQHLTHNIQHTTHNIQHTTHKTQHKTYKTYLGQAVSQLSCKCVEVPARSCMKRCLITSVLGIEPRKSNSTRTVMSVEQVATAASLPPMENTLRPVTYVV
jgi:ribosomal protein S12